MCKSLLVFFSTERKIKSYFVQIYHLLQSHKLWEKYLKSNKNATNIYMYSLLGTCQYYIIIKTQ